MFAHSVHPLDWLCSKKQRQQEENLPVSLSHMCVKMLTFFRFFLSPEFFTKYLETMRVLSSLALSEHKFLSSSLPNSNLCWWAQWGGQRMVG